MHAPSQSHLCVWTEVKRHSTTAFFPEILATSPKQAGNGNLQKAATHLNGFSVGHSKPLSAPGLFLSNKFQNPAANQEGTRSPQI